jgi:hypothetical protein
MLDVQTLLQVIPIEESERKEILLKYPQMTDDQKLEIKEYCWRIYFFLIKNKTNYEFKEALSKIVKDKNAKLSNNLYSDIRKKVIKEIDDMIIHAQDKNKLETTREELVNLLHKSL